ncbi:DNA-directed RNA polymerase subunit beta' [Candidatus Uhrbacteria bacterium RIFCSPLOWO2_02_FULL_48_18]|uniref:DNA-directed RNA polymerase subunit beta' n=1 Tax=Candidatus Uhrbacteria bacterium RIFCSPLOWO2_02_FULL_48_18 TaxID=1802408 RepID=A0A1F7VCR8_9BACT|nr:MAG: DNA-directed RNA polymerase subunit beta' [Candidatus Uhrbacteria bacterium RIFCSPHIGHO2_01_FULL_47_10]OGL80572.1 MAG: DNA-directed RNA polymerase subunit beta' [Candidatus Uhrbacteria bacterium RIFCSPLOWO2_01_FULL_47_17]OGL88245.1 MAG: DNA-directed RNA polymerase subunit beta' [Candidatus Uhrbacteria bacterium RIFCSPLOWO2_02_FULL_48_18]
MFKKQDALKSTDFDSIRLRLASPEAIRSWSYGEVSKPETINYRTQKPEKSGLFAEEIFGPSKDWECYCGKYKKIRYKGIVCDKCGVEVTHSIVRRERMGHIELACPITHIWFLRGVPSKIGTVLDLSVQNLEKVIYFASFLITDINQEAKDQTEEQVKQELKSKQKMIEGEYKRDVGRLQEKFQGDNKKIAAEIKRLDEVRDQKTAELDEDYEQVMSDLKEMEVMRIISEQTYHEWSLKYGHIFEAGIGAGAVKEMLKRINVEETMKKLEDELISATRTKRDRVLRRLKLLKSLHVNGIKPEWMVLAAVPIIPPDLRPMVPLDGGRFATSDLNDLYRRVINRNNRLRRLFELNAPDVISRNEKRMLQEAVDSLIDNSARHSKTVIAATGKKRQLKSLADQLKGKQGRFRQNLLGKRIDYSGRSVIVVGPHLKLDQCGIPKKMALELFKPFIISKLIEREYVHNIRSANRFIESDRPETWDILEEVTKDAFVLLNRAPTLHRLGIQAFRPTLIEGKAIQIHPLVCDAYNADFDGDQMAVHVPLTEEARAEARELMLATKNLLKPAHGGPVATPGKDIAWGIYYLTMTLDDMPTEKTGLQIFATESDVQYAVKTEKLGLRSWVVARLKNGEVLVTTPGRIIVNMQFPKEVPFQNSTMGKKELSSIVKYYLELHGSEKTAAFLDRLKEIGFTYATKAGYSYGMANLPVVNKKEFIQDGERRVREVEDFFAQGLLTQSERHSSIIKIWNEIKDKIADVSKKALPKDNPAYTMIESGARGTWGQMTQTVGMKGLVSNPSGEVIELPVTSSYRDGYDVLEFFISSHGVRKGLTDTALRTANAGYLTRRLVDVAQDVSVREEDCGDEAGVVLTKKESDEIGEPLIIRILGRYTLADVQKPGGRKVVVKAGELITEEHIREIEEGKAELEQVNIRSVMTCKLRRGICKKCYGYDLAYNKEVKLGTSVGIMAAQSIGEPGTQLTMRTFHTGGVAGKDITQGLPRVEELFEARNPKQKAIMSEVAGKVTVDTAAREIVQAGTGKQIVDMRPGQKTVKIAYEGLEEEAVIYGKAGKLNVKDGAKVKMGQLLATKSDGTELASPHNGVVKAEKPGIAMVIFETEKIREYIIPPGFSLYVKDGDEVQAGDALTDGNLDLQVLFKTKGQNAVQKYLSKEIQFIYASQGQKVNNKHIEIIIRQMFSRVRVIDTGDTDLLPGEIIEKATYLDALDTVPKGGNVATCEPLFLGITKISLSTDSWLSSASFQETARVLINAAVTGKVDTLQGLKENVIIGRLIPAGTGFKDMGTELIGQMPVYDDVIIEDKADVLDEEIKKAFEENRAIEVAAAKAEIAAAE